MNIVAWGFILLFGGSIVWQIWKWQQYFEAKHYAEPSNEEKSYFLVEFQRYRLVEATDEDEAREIGLEWARRVPPDSFSIVEITSMPLKEMCREAYEQGGATAVYDLFAYEVPVDMPWEYCPSCDVTNPIVDENCAVCGTRVGEAMYTYRRKED